MKGIAIIVLGIVLISLCGIGYRYMQLDGSTCGLIAFFIGGGMVTSGINMANQGAAQIAVEEDDERPEDE